ncbi:MAG: hypothetical protein ACTSO7_07950 [Candidatus Heimdallarchaeota archaeon]
MKDLVAVLKNVFESNEIKVEYADVIEEFMEETGELEICYNNLSYCVYVYPAQEQLPGLINFEITPKNLEPLFLMLKKEIIDSVYTLEKFGETNEKELYMRLSLEKKRFNVYTEKIESSKPDYGVF